MSVDRQEAESADVRQRIETYLTRCRFSGRTRVVPLTGDASDRSYFRVFTPASPSTVLAVHAGPFDYTTLPFVTVASLLRKMPVPIPAILDHHDDLGILALEDLGDVTLQAHLGAASTAAHADLYRQAVGLIAVVQRRGVELADYSSLPYTVAFDVPKLTWELDFFVKYFVEGYRGLTVSPSLAAGFREEWSQLVDEIAAEPRVLCHRDYHSRNLMWHRDSLYIIDFQDARMGPETYDLVSLLRDSYVDLSADAVDELVAYFLAVKGSPADPRDFRRRFDVMALQRNLKALGTFGYQTAVRSNPVYIQYIPRTLRHVRDNLARHSRFGRLRDLLSVIEELR